MEDVKISVIIPVYNTAGLVEKCLASVMAQTHPDLEIIVVDDGSTDDSGEVVERIAATDPRIQVIHRRNGGASAARNSGLALAGGAYVGFVDSDDYIEPSMYAELLSLARRKDLAIVQTARIEEDTTGARLPDVCPPPPTETIISTADFFRDLLLHRGDASFCTKLIKKELLTAEHFPEKALNEEIDLFIRLMPQISHIGILPARHYHVVYHPTSTTRTKSADSFSRVFADMVANADTIEALVKKQYPRLTAEAKRFALYQRLEYLLHIPITMMKRTDTSTAPSSYRAIVSYLRRNLPHTLTNPHLSGKDRLYLLLLTTAPKTVRRIHAAVSGGK